VGVVFGNKKKNERAQLPTVLAQGSDLGSAGNNNSVAKMVNKNPAEIS